MSNEAFNTNEQAIHQRINNDFAIVIAASYRSNRNITELQSLLVLAQQLEIALAELPATLSNRARIKAVRLHIREISKRISRVGDMNTNKSNERSKLIARGRLMDSLTETGLISTLVTESRIARSEAMKQAKADTKAGLEAIAPSIKREFELAGYDPTASSEDRAKWQREQDALKQGLPGTDLEAQGQEAMNILQRAEQERADIEVRELGDSGLKTLDDGKDKIGSVEDWIKNL